MGCCPIIRWLPVGDWSAHRRGPRTSAVASALVIPARKEDGTLPWQRFSNASEVIGVVVAAMMLFIRLGSMIAAGLPLIAAIAGVGALVVLSFSGVVEQTETTPILGLMLGLTVDIDYSLFIRYRHRQKLRAWIRMRQSIGLATGTSGTAVRFAGITVIIVLAALNSTGIGFLGLMGTAGSAVRSKI
ncbi:hypothetical protein E3O44_06585 [Cryobacterium algoricola]|uniref:Membrane transport protein MMPL domain-containing protein n=1 Tax=Cryobacterium algoricola TaxID=1259183 RepID=A0ABY2IEK3_9MICO|nr:hypothetical protein E3O44_06585 [Cryobacterium algoricola]